MPRDPVRPASARSSNSSSSSASSRASRRRLDRLFPRLRNLRQREQLQVCCFMSALVNGDDVAALIEQARRPYLACPDCRCTAYSCCGHANDLQRFKCKACGRTYNALTGTPLARLRLKTRWLAYFDCLRDASCTVNSAAATVGVHATTSFRWRHRFLRWTKLDRPAQLVGIVELAESTPRVSEKGSRQLKRAPRRRGGPASAAEAPTERVNLLIARDRSGQTVDAVSAPGKLTVKHLHAQLRPRLATDIVLVGGADPAIRAFSRDARIHHWPIPPQAGIEQAHPFHLDNVNAYHERYTAWLHHFRGVATRYLSNYLGWRWAIDRQRIDSAPRFLRAALGVFTS